MVCLPNGLGAHCLARLLGTGSDRQKFGCTVTYSIVGPLIGTVSGRTCTQRTGTVFTLEDVETNRVSNVGHLTCIATCDYYLLFTVLVADDPL